MKLRQMNHDEIRYWYENELAEAFAENERKPLEDIFTLIEDGRYEIWGLFDLESGAGVGSDSELRIGEPVPMLGYACLWKRPGIPLVLLDYLGVNARLRSRGLGAKILAELQSHGYPIVTESELPVDGASEVENSIRLRRIEFYKRNGFTPSYEMATCGMRWQALLANTSGSANATTPSAYSLDDIMKWHKALYGPERTDVQVPIGPDETPAMPYWMNHSM